MVMPLWDESPLKLAKLPVVTWGLIFANVAVFLFTATAPDELQPVFLNFAVIPANITGTPIGPTPVPPFLTLVTYQFLHANIWHLLGNMIFLWVFGDDIEEAMGSLRFIGYYLACGVAAALIFVASTPHSQMPLVGASGAIAGVLAAYLMLRPCQKVLVFLPWFLLWFIVRPVVRLDAYWVLGAWLLVQVWSISVQTQDDVAYMAHVGAWLLGRACFQCCATAPCGYLNAYGRSSRRRHPASQASSVHRSINVDRPMGWPLASARAAKAFTRDGG